MDVREVNFPAEIAVMSGRRRDVRRAVSLDAKVLNDGLKRSLCKVEDLSRTGARIQTYSSLAPKSDIALVIPDLGVRASRVVWARDFCAGIEFHDPLSLEELERISSR